MSSSTQMPPPSPPALLPLTVLFTSTSVCETGRHPSSAMPPPSPPARLSAMVEAKRNTLEPPVEQPIQMPPPSSPAVLRLMSAKVMGRVAEPMVAPSSL